MKETEIHDVIIVGAGPAGLTAAIFAINKKLKVLLIDGSKAGGQLESLYPHKPVYNYPGYARIQAGALASKMLDQVRDENIDLLEDEPICKITCLEKGLFHLDGDQNSYHSRAIVLACGMGLFEPRRLQVPGEKELAHENIFYRLTDIDEWENLTVAVIGGGNSALDNVALLSKKAKKIFLIHRLSDLQAEEAAVDRLYKHHHAGVFLGWMVSGLKKENNNILVQIENSADKTMEKLPVDRVLINIGLKANILFLEDLPISRNKKRIIVDSEMKTSIPGIFACGDAVVYPGKVRLIVTAIGEAATAVSSLEEYLRSNESNIEEGNK